jgi:uncharacterized protein GlcG (DUF336 family)
MYQEVVLSLDDARLARRAVLHALDAGTDRPAALAVCDARGGLVHALRQDGAAARLLSRARAKAYTSAVMGCTTLRFREDVIEQPGRAIGDFGDAWITSLQGGVVVRSEGRVVGAVGCAGNSIDRDEALAVAGATAIETQAELPEVRRAQAAASGRLSARDACAAAEAISAWSAAEGAAVASAVVDSHGDIIHVARMDRATPFDVEQAIRKAFTSAYMGRGTSSLHEQLLADGRRPGDWGISTITTLPGGALIAAPDGGMLGAVGVHGSALGDDEAAIEGVAAIARDRPSR